MGFYVVTHKKLKKTFPEGYKTIVVNSNVNKIQGDIYDNVGDNISSKNGSYCELTAIYWLWKNCNDSFIGIDHYRRFFIENESYLTVQSAEKLINDHIIILPEKEKFRRNMSSLYYTSSGYKNDLKVLRQVINRKYPKYIVDFDRFMQQHEMYCYNMSVMNKKDFDQYCNWLFDILFETEKILNSQNKGVNNRKGYFKRIYGFMSERLLNIYVMHNNFKAIELPVKFDGQKPTTVQRIFSKLKKIKYKYL